MFTYIYTKYDIYSTPNSNYTDLNEHTLPPSTPSYLNINSRAKFLPPNTKFDIIEKAEKQENIKNKNKKLLDKLGIKFS